MYVCLLRLSGKDLQQVLHYHDSRQSDETLRKTALQWTVENKDAFCATIILRKENELHKGLKRQGLISLRKQVSVGSVDIFTAIIIID